MKLELLPHLRIQHSPFLYNFGGELLLDLSTGEVCSIHIPELEERDDLGLWAAPVRLQLEQLSSV